MRFSIASAFLLVSGVSAFVQPSAERVSTTSLQMSQDDNNMKKAAASFAAAAILMTNIAAEPAMALDDMASASADFGSTQVVAARSGGRAGGRSSAARSAPRSSPARSSTRVINRTTTNYVAPPVYGGAVVAPIGGFGYNPYPGLGLSMGLNAINDIGRDMRDYRQEGEIRDARSQLQQSQMREQDMEARMRQMEQQMQYMQMQQAQQQGQAAPAPASQ